MKKSIKTGTAIFVIGFILMIICNSIFGNGSNSTIYFLILLSILYLAAVIAGATSLILDELREK